MTTRYRRTMALIRQVLARFQEIGGPLISAGIAFYAFLSAAPLAVVAIAMAGALFGEAAAQGELEAHVLMYLGPEGSSLFNRLILSTHRSEQGIWASMLSLSIVAFAASRFFTALERALNLVWDISPTANSDLRSKTRVALGKRIRAFVFVLAASTGLILMLIIKMITDALIAITPSPLFAHSIVVDIFQILGLIVTLTAFNAVAFRHLPQAELSWREVGLGSFVTAVLVTLGALLTGLYTRKATLTSTYGAAGTLGLILIWAYYSCQVFVLGAVFTCIWGKEDPITLERNSKHHAQHAHRTDT